MSTDLRSGFNRLFVVLTFVWAVYCLLVYPIQRQRQVDKVFKGEFQNCVDERTGQEFRGCIDNAELKASTSMEFWSLKAYYSREGWFLGLIVVAVPLLAYAVGLWVGRRLRPNPAEQ
jgi:hypothetical protein